MTGPTAISRALDGFSIPEWADPFVRPEVTGAAIGTELALATDLEPEDARRGIDEALTDAGYDVTWAAGAGEAVRDELSVAIDVDDRRRAVPSDPDAETPADGEEVRNWLERNMRRKTNARLAKVARKAGPPPEMERTLVVLSVPAAVTPA